MEALLARLLRQEPELTEEEAQALLAEQMSDDPLAELYNFGSSIVTAPLGATSLVAEGLRATGLYDEPSVIEGVPDYRPGVEEFPGTYEWAMEKVGAEPYAPESIVGSFMDPGALATVLPAKVMAQALRQGKIGQYPTTTAGRIRNKTMDQGGYTVNLMTGEVPTEGIMMGTYANDSGKTGVLQGPKVKAKEITSWVKQNAGPLSRVNNHLGTWIDTADNKLYLDVAKWFAPDELRQATKFGEKTAQKAGFNLGTFEETPVGNWQEFIRSPEFQDRMSEMEAIGREYLSKHANPEWWDIHGTLFEEIYGSERLAQVAGFVASTSPSTDPTTNLRLASEYMRRLIKGEDILQPNWRVPEGTQTRNPGTQLSHHEGIGGGANLEKAARGDYRDLQANKVNDMAKAMMGDPDASVLDRWWTRIAEKPEAGIYTGTQEGAFLKPTKGLNQYQELKKVVAEAAKAAGRSARDFSADVWAGMREVAKNTGELFGQKMKPGAIAGESKGQADILNDLVESKANFLGISRTEMIERLKRGDENLLSLLLATPLGAYLYAQLQTGEDNADAF